jgi:hypothetical protein
MICHGQNAYAGGSLPSMTTIHLQQQRAAPAAAAPPGKLIALPAALECTEGVDS